MKILLVYEEIPEATHLYALDVNEKDAATIMKCHRRYINHEMSKADQKACDWLSEFIEKLPKLDDKKPVDLAGFDRLVISGFVL